jgi:uncharacterized alpha-E superfamily protein
MRYLLERLETVLQKLKAPARSAPAHERVAPLRADLSVFLRRLEDEEEFGPAKRQESLVFLRSVRERLSDLHDYLTTTYFSHVGYHG